MSELSDVLESIEPEWVLQREGVTYKESYGRSGRQFNLRECPFCHKAEWRVYVNAETLVGNCFSGSCPQKTWSKWTFLKGLLDVSGRELHEAVRNLAREQGWRPKIAPSLGLQDINTLDLPPCTPAWEVKPQVEYLARRGVFEELAEYFQLHWCDKGVWNYMDPRGFEGSQDYSGRIIIPILDLDGELVSFQGRDATGESETRYLFPPGFASAGSYLYNALNITDETEALVVCEGVFDVIQVKRSVKSEPGLEKYEPIGTFGMHLSSGNPSGDDQLGRLRKIREEKGVNRLIFMWDGEQKAALAAINQSLAASAIGFQCSIAFLPDGQDPGNSRPNVICDALRSALPCRTKLDAVKLKREVLRYKTA